MTPTQRKKWELIRSKGLIHYILVEGILRRGILAGIIAGPFPFLMANAIGRPINWVWLVITSALLALLFGIFFGILFWRLQEKEYQKSDSDNTQTH